MARSPTSLSLLPKLPLLLLRIDGSVAALYRFASIASSLVIHYSVTAALKLTPSSISGHFRPVRPLNGEGDLAARISISGGRSVGWLAACTILSPASAQPLQYESAVLHLCLCFTLSPLAGLPALPLASASHFCQSASLARTSAGGGADGGQRHVCITRCHVKNSHLDGALLLLIRRCCSPCRVWIQVASRVLFFSFPLLRKARGKSPAALFWWHAFIFENGRGAHEHHQHVLQGSKRSWTLPPSRASGVWPKTCCALSGVRS